VFNTEVKTKVHSFHLLIDDHEPRPFTGKSSVNSVLTGLMGEALSYCSSFMVLCNGNIVDYKYKACRYSIGHYLKLVCELFVM